MPKKTATAHFPTKLHEVLDEAEEKGHSHIISWLEDGKSFRIHKPAEMVPVLARYFRQTKYKSLLRQLQGYNFHRVTSGNNRGDVSHPLFVRGNRALCADMKRKQASSAKAPNSDMLNNKKKLTPPRARYVSQDQPDYTSSNAASSNNLNNAKQLEMNFRQSMKRVVPETKDKHRLSTVLSAPSLVKTNTNDPRHGRHQPKGMDALRVEIGCSFSSSRTPSGQTSSFKRRVPQQPYKIQSSVSSPEFENGRLAKRQRSHEGMQHIHSNSAAQTFQNASFSFSAPRGSQKAREDAILMEEKMQFEKMQKEKLDQQQFERLEKLCFSNLPQHSTSAMGTLDLDISLTTTTTTTHHNGTPAQVSSNTITNKYVLPSSLLEPTPILERKSTQTSTNASNGFTLSCGFNFSSKPANKNNGNMGILLKVPSATIAPNQLYPESNSIAETEVSDEIDEGICEAFGENNWSFESDCEDCQDCEEDDWAKNITYHGKTDCVLEPEKFQVEEQRLLLGAQQQQQQQQQQQPQVNMLQAQQQQLLQQHKPQHQLQAAMHHNRNFNQIAPRPTQLAPQVLAGNIQRQQLARQNPYALLSKAMPLRPQSFPNQIQIQQLQR